MSGGSQVVSTALRATEVRDVQSWDDWDQQEFGLGAWLWQKGSMAQSFPSLHHRTLIHCVKEEVIGSKRATKGQREKKILPPWFVPSVRFYLSNLRNVFPQACWVLKAIHALPPYLLLLYYFPSSQVLALTNLWACLYGRRWQMRTAAFSTPSFHPHTTLHQVLTPSWPCSFADNLTGVWAVHLWLWGQNTSRAQRRVLPFCFISLAQIIRKLYNIVLQHTCYLVYKLLPHVCTVPAYQESQLIIISYQNPNRCCKICLHAEWGYWSCTNHYIASKDELGSLRSSLCNE